MSYFPSEQSRVVTMKVRNESLHVAMKAYVSAALEFVTKHAKEAQASSGSDDFDFYWVMSRYSCDLPNLPEHEACLLELRNDEEISRHLDQNVGSYSRGTLTPNSESMMKHVLDLGRLNGSYDFNPDRFDREYSIFEDTYYSEALRCEAIAPLQGLLLEIPVVDLSSDVEISRLEEEEMKPYRAQNSHWDSRWCAVRVKYQIPKVIGSKECEDRFLKMEKERASEEMANQRIEEVVNAVRLLGKCDVYHSGIIHQTPKWLYIHDRSFANRVLGTGFITYSFAEGEAHSLKALWNKLEMPIVKKELDVAVRRFGDSCVRHRNEDKLIDLMIAAESLFLRGTKEGEKSFRLAFRAGQFLGEGGSAKQVYDRMRLAYYCRSVLVHGGRPSADRKLKKIDLGELVAGVGDDIQAAIFKAMNLLGSPEIDGNLDEDYWERYLFSAQS